MDCSLFNDYCSLFNTQSGKHITPVLTHEMTVDVSMYFIFI